MPSNKNTKKKYSKKSQLYTKQVRLLLFWLTGFTNFLYKYASLFNESEADKTLRTHIETKILEIRKMITDHSGPRIGKQVISEMKF